MNTEIDYTAVRDDLKSRIEQLQSALAAVENILSSVGQAGASGNHRTANTRQDVQPDEFLGMSIPDAATKFLELVRFAQTIAQIHEGIQKGGLPHTKYNAVYTAIWRREFPAGVFARVPDSDTSWGLAEWWPTNPGIKKKIKTITTGAKASTRKSKTMSRKKPSVPVHDLVEQLLRDEGKPLHASILIERLEKGFNRITKARSLSASMPKDPKNRFENLGGNTWALSEWSLSQKQLPLD